MAGLCAPAAPAAPRLSLHPPGPGKAEQVAGDHVLFLLVAASMKTRENPGGDFSPGAAASPGRSSLTKPAADPARRKPRGVLGKSGVQWNSKPGSGAQRMTVMSLVVLVLSWGSLGLEAATAVGLSDFCSSPDTYVLNLTQEETGLGSDILNYYFLCNQAVSNPFQQRLTLSQRALANIHSQLQGLEREAVPHFPSAQKPLLSLEETLNVTEGNFHQLVALLHCRGLHKDYGAALRGLCEDVLEGLLFLLLFSLLSAGALATALCSLPRAWALFPPSDDYDDTDDDDPFNPQESKRFVQWQSSI
uniref:Protein tweety homolog n=1 Tax=Rousettus aegyptiacus TaxID=9407 RepID=A0A7J8CMK7_ROUAE|nr:tweety family member 1 [Rousettus aegyptiacus]